MTVALKQYRAAEATAKEVVAWTCIEASIFRLPGMLAANEDVNHLAVSSPVRRSAFADYSCEVGIALVNFRVASDARTIPPEVAICTVCDLLSDAAAAAILDQTHLHFGGRT